MRYKEVDIYENDVSAEEETEIQSAWIQSKDEECLQAEEQKEEKYYQRRPHICGLFFYI